MSISRLSTTSLSTALTARNTVNPLDSLSSHYKKTKILILTIFVFINIMYIDRSPVLYIINKATRF